MSSRMSCTPRSRRRRYCRIRLSGSPAMSRLGQLEAALDPLDPSVQAIQPPPHAAPPLLDAQALSPAAERPLPAPGPSPIQAPHVLAHALQPAVQAAEGWQEA